MPAPGLDHDAVTAALYEARAGRAPIPPLTQAGQLVITGALHAAVALEPGVTYRADFDRLGTAIVRASATPGGAR